jgi:hypothetical protein
MGRPCRLGFNKPKLKDKKLKNIWDYVLSVRCAGTALFSREKRRGAGAEIRRNPYHR